MYSPLPWKPVPDYESYYQINPLGTVRGIERTVVHKNGSITCSRHYMSTRLNNCGYVEIRLHKDGKTKSFLLHALLAKTFIPNPGRKPEVNHINGIKTDNRLENLEWVTHQENMQHASEMGLLNRAAQYKKVIDLTTGKVFEKVSDAAAYYSLSLSTCKNYLNGNRKNQTPLRYYSKETMWQFMLTLPFILYKLPLLEIYYKGFEKYTQKQYNSFDSETLDKEYKALINPPDLAKKMDEIIK